MRHSCGLVLLDQGSHASKAVVAEPGGRVSSTGVEPIRTTLSAEGYCEHDPDELLASVRTAVDQAVADAEPADSWKVGLATQRSTVVCWDRESGRALYPVISWRDRRNADWLAGLDLDPEAVRKTTGLVPSAHYGASKIRWCIDHVEAVRRALEQGRLCCGPLSSFVLFGLLEERPFVVDPANASRTLLWDVNTGDWSPDMTAAFGIEAETLPACVASRHAFGTLSAGGHKLPLEVCTGDQAAALFAGGEPDHGTVYVNIGTGAFAQRRAGADLPAAPGLLRSVAWRDGENQVGVLEGTVNGAGAALDWLAGELGMPADALTSQAGEWLDRAAGPPVFINGIGGVGSPFWLPHVPSRFIGEGDDRARLVAVVESIAFALMANMQAMDKALGPARRIVVTGGLARLDGLCDRLAALSGLPVERPGNVEATAAGLAWLVSGEPIGTRRKPCAFEPGSDSGIATRYQIWLDAMGTLAGR